MGLNGIYFLDEVILLPYVNRNREQLEFPIPHPRCHRLQQKQAYWILIIL